MVGAATYRHWRLELLALCVSFTFFAGAGCALLGPHGDQPEGRVVNAADSGPPVSSINRGVPPGLNVAEAQIASLKSGDGRRPGTLGSGDTISVTVFGEEELTGEYRVASNGSIFFPMVGSFEVAGFTNLEVAAKLSTTLKRFLVEPQVAVEIKEYRSQKVYIMGLVATPGAFVYQPELTIIEAITLAGGFASTADQNATYVQRTVNGEKRRILVKVKDIGRGRAPNFEVLPGDLVYVPESLF